MMNLYVFKERLKGLYAKFGIYITPLWKFVLSLFSIFCINDMTGQQRHLQNPVIIVGIALVCAFIPQSGLVAVISVILLFQLYAISLEVMLVTLALIMIMFMVYYGIKPGNAILLILVPVAFVLRIPYALPLCIGLTCGISAIIPAAFGVIIYYILVYASQNVGQLMSGGSAMDLTRYTQFIDSVIGNRMIQLTILTFAVTILVVYIIRRLTIDFAWSIAIGLGAISEITILLIGDFVFEVAISLGSFLISMVFSILIAFILEFFLFSVDYSRTEYTQFEDDDYYYYVKAVPKIAVTAPDVKVQKFTSRKGRNGEKPVSGRRAGRISDEE